jgi:hypothetical protein
VDTRFASDREVRWTRGVVLGTTAVSSLALLVRTVSGENWRVASALSGPFLFATNSDWWCLVVDVAMLVAPFTSRRPWAVAVGRVGVVFWILGILVVAASSLD